MLAGFMKTVAFGWRRQLLPMRQRQRPAMSAVIKNLHSLWSGSLFDLPGQVIILHRIGSTNYNVAFGFPAQ